MIELGQEQLFNLIEPFQTKGSFRLTWKQRLRILFGTPVVIHAFFNPRCAARQPNFIEKFSVRILIDI